MWNILTGQGLLATLCGAQGLLTMGINQPEGLRSRKSEDINRISYALPQIASKQSEIKASSS